MYLLRKSRFRVNLRFNFAKIELKVLFFPLQQRAENALKFYRGFKNEVGEMNGKVKLEYDNMTCIIKTGNCDATRGKLTFGDFSK